MFYIEIPARLWYNIFTVHNGGNIWTFFFNKIFSEGKIAKKQQIILWNTVFASLKILRAAP